MLDVAGKELKEADEARAHSVAELRSLQSQLVLLKDQLKIEQVQHTEEVGNLSRRLETDRARGEVEAYKLCTGSHVEVHWPLRYSALFSERVRLLTMHG